MRHIHVRPAGNLRRSAEEEKEGLHGAEDAYHQSHLPLLSQSTRVQMHRILEKQNAHPTGLKAIAEEMTAAQTDGAP